MLKVNLNSKNVENYLKLTKNSRKGFLTVTHVSTGICNVEVDNGGDIKTFENQKISDVARTYDARNWTVIEEDIKTEEFDTSEYDEAYNLKLQDDVKTEESFNTLEEEEDEDKEVVLEVELENKRVITNKGAYTLASKSEMFQIMHELGCSPAQISKMCNAHYSFVFGVLKRRGVTSTRQNTGKTKSQAMIEMYEQGKTAKEISVELGAHPSFVYGVISKYKKGLM